MIIESPEFENRVGIERAFEVLRNHTVHTKGYVLTALKVIEEFGSAEDKESLAALLKEKNQAIILPTPEKTVPKKRKVAKSK